MKVLVTGGAGFIGSNLCRELLIAEGVTEVRVIDDLSTGYADNLDGVEVRVTVGSILDEACLEAAAAGVDAVVHLAALGSVPRSVEDPLATHAVNATGTLNVLEVARRNNAHVLLASSSSVYGSNPTLPKSEDLACTPMSPYAVSKLATEQYAMAYSQCYGLRVLPFRFFNVYGPRQRAGHDYAAVVPTFVDAALRDEELVVHGDGSQSRDFTYVGTVTAVLVAGVVRGTTAGPTNLAFGTRTDLLSVVDLISKHVDHPLRVRFGPDRAGDVKHSQASSDRLRALFPEVTPVALSRGIAETVRWMRDVVDSNVSGHQL